MRVVVDTNVLVSGLLRNETPPAEVVHAVLEGEVIVLYDERILAEYQEVLRVHGLVRVMTPRQWVSLRRAH